MGRNWLKEETAARCWWRSSREHPLKRNTEHGAVEPIFI